MNKIIKIGKLAKYVPIILICLISQITISISADKLFTINEKDDYLKLMQIGNYYDAYNYLKNTSNIIDIDRHVMLGLLEGSGKLSGGINRCAAVYNLELALNLGENHVINSLDFLYNGSWAAIASLEGSSIALQIVGEQMLKTTPISILFNVINKNSAIEVSSIYLYKAADLKDRKAKEIIEKNKLLQPNQDLNFTFAKVYCDVRNPL